nr:lipopolysaccharide heptosyltransferase family protein [Desulfobacterales bacterium]
MPAAKIPFQRSQIRKILVVRNDNIGDVVCTTPCFEALRRHFPKAFISVLVCRLTEEVVTGNPFIDKVFVYDKAKHGRYKNSLIAWWKQFNVLQKVRKEGFDLAIGIRSEFSRSQAWLVYASGAPYRLGVKPSRKNRKFSFFYNVYVEQLKDNVHEIERSLHILRRMGVDIDEKRLFLKLLTKNVKKANNFFSKYGISIDSKIVCVNFSRRIEEGRYWNYENYVAVLKRLQKHKIQAIATCSPDEETIVRNLLNSISNSVPLYHSKSLKDFAAVISLCSVFVTIDGGPMHVAAAVGTPVIALFGKTDPKTWSPWGDQHTVIRKGDDHNLIKPGEVFDAIMNIVKTKKTSSQKGINLAS